MSDEPPTTSSTTAAPIEVETTPAPVVADSPAVKTDDKESTAPDADATKEDTKEKEKEKEPVDPLTINLPDEDDSELTWHKTTLIQEEDIREAVTIPAAFAAQYLWSPTAPPSSSESTKIPGTHPSSHVVIPPALLADTHAALSTALSSATQLASVPPKPSSTTSSPSDVAPPDPEPLPEPVVTLFCPYDNTAGVIDTIVSGVGLSQRADVLVLDTLMFAQGEAGPLGPGECCGPEAHFVG